MAGELTTGPDDGAFDLDPTLVAADLQQVIIGGCVAGFDTLMLGSVEHTDDPLFSDVPNPIEVARYHSLVIEPESLPAELSVTAHTAEAGFSDEIQGVKHREFPVWGVQFHPESIASQAGRQIVENFLRMG